MLVINREIAPNSIVYTNYYGTYNALDESEFHYHRINHSVHFAKGKSHINGIENFWNQAKCHLLKFNGILKEHFYLFLKEYEWRFNHSDPKEQLSILKQLVKK